MEKVPATTSEAARECRASEDTIRRACDDGRLKAVRTASGQRLIDRDSLAEFVKGRRGR